ncbi:hypothetical protein MK852_03885 [Shewanella benthica]|uniref:hypothetical protein n=1 Tax=Shewanella TaxID=22 RepID=UPI000C109660|nr:MULTISPECIES: hypothetical protein [Shewanella]MBE7214038.1 hypothetical protein [Shewanella benthica]MBL4814303.1 hypothetical protein [Shewanella sp.]MCJ8303278.1 hypothetical protein [Shewanella sp.]MCL1061279.1 hypothetical protein [Shewanella benthica]PHQ76344.1 MAG: hypothetical protein COB74_02610 [Shewanella sp.]
MRFQQLSELLSYVATCRVEMAKLYSRLQTEADSTRVKMMLEYFQQHQRGVSEKLENYIDSAPKKVLDTWYKDIIFEDFIKRCHDIVLTANMSEEDILELHLKLDNLLIDLLQVTAEHSSSVDIAGTLNELVRVERIQQQRLVHSSIRMDDI